MKTSGSIESKTRPSEGRVGVGGSKTRCEGSKLDRNKLDDGEVHGGEVENDEVGKKVQKTSKSKNLFKSILDFLTLGAKLAFIKLRQVFLKAPILYHFDPERYIRIETNASGYAISTIFS